MLSPLGLHFALLLGINLLPTALRVPLALAPLGAILTIPQQPNIYSQLNIGRQYSGADLLAGLDRLELTHSEEDIAILEEKLTGKTSSYHWKAADLFGDTHPLGGFEAKLSSAKEQRAYRFIGDAILIYYSSFIFFPPTFTQKSRVLLLFVLMGALGIQLGLYDYHPQLSLLGQQVQQTLFSLPQFSNWTVYQLAELFGYLLSAALLFSLAITPRLSSKTFLSELQSLSTSSNLAQKAKSLLQTYSPLATIYSQRSNIFPKVKRVLAAMVGLIAFAQAYDHWNQPITN